MSDEAAADPTRRETYRVWGQETVRFSDTDAYGHVNNTSFAAYLETGRTTFARACGLPVGLRHATHIVLARVEIDYRAEVHWPAVLDLGSSVLRLGRSSITLDPGGVYRRSLRRDGAGGAGDGRCRDPPPGPAHGGAARAACCGTAARARADPFASTSQGTSA